VRLLPSRITSRRLELRSPVPADAARIAELLGNWNVIRMLGTPPWPYRLADAESWLASLADREAGHQSDHRALVFGGQLCGAITIERRQRGYTLGYWLGEPYWGRGLMSEAALAYVAAVFAAKVGDELVSGALPENLASLRIQQKLGFERTGERILPCRPRGMDMPHIDTVLRRERFQVLHP